jgi:hypothetical protein
MSKPDSGALQSAGFGSPSIRKLKANARRFSGRHGPFERPRRPIGFARDCVPSGQSQNRNLHSERRAPGRRDFSSNCWKNPQFLGRTMVADTLLRKRNNLCSIMPTSRSPIASILNHSVYQWKRLNVTIYMSSANICITLPQIAVPIFLRKTNRIDFYFASSASGV